MGPNSGLPVQSTPGRAGSGSLVTGTTALSNTNLDSELVNLVKASSHYRSSFAVMKISDTLFDDLVNLGRAVSATIKELISHGPSS